LAPSTPRLSSRLRRSTLAPQLQLLDPPYGQYRYLDRKRWDIRLKLITIDPISLLITNGKWHIFTFKWQKNIDLGRPWRSVCAIVVKQYEIGLRLLMINNRKWHTLFQMKWKSSTLHNLEGHWKPVRSAILATAGLVVDHSRAAVRDFSESRGKILSTLSWKIVQKFV